MDGRSGGLRLKMRKLPLTVDFFLFQEKGIKVPRRVYKGPTIFIPSKEVFIHLFMKV